VARRTISRDQVTQVAELIAAQPGASRRALSIRVCETWNWVQPNGASCDALCRGLLLILHRAGADHIARAHEIAYRRPHLCEGEVPVAEHSAGAA